MACLNPIALKNREIVVPCGKCIMCLKEKRDSWTFRVGMEFKKASTAYFITLTYDDESLPRNKGRPTLLKRELHSFIANVKKRNKREVTKYWKKHMGSAKELKMKKVKYFAVGEYGDQLQRPHYHIIIMNIFGETIKYLQEMWDRGNVDIEIPRGQGAIHYVTGYLFKAKRWNKYDVREKQFLAVSKGMGDWYLMNKKYHQGNMTTLCNINGFKIGLPRIFKEKMFTKEQREQLREENLERKIKLDSKWIDKKTKEGIYFVDYLEEQIQLKEKHLNKQKSKKRKL